MNANALLLDTSMSLCNAISFVGCCRSRKREHLHTLQMRLSVLEQENEDLVQQVAVRDAELKRFKRERGDPDGKCTYLLYASEPAAKTLAPTSSLSSVSCKIRQT